MEGSETACGRWCGRCMVRMEDGDWVWTGVDGGVVWMEDGGERDWVGRWMEGGGERDRVWSGVEDGVEVGERGLVVGGQRP